MSNLLGQHMLTIDCMSNIDTRSLGRIFVGIAEDGSWCCFKNFQCYSNELIILLQYHMRVITQCLKTKTENVKLSSFGEVSK